MRRFTNKGFSLVELMIVMAIMGILAAFVYPSYTEYLRRGHRSEAQATMMEAAHSLQRFYTVNNSYQNAALNASQKVSPATGDPRYNISVNIPASNTTFTLTATPTSRFPDTACGNLTLTSTGVKGSSAGSVEQCWK